MPAVYSTRFFAVSTSADENLTYTVPAGQVAVLRDVSFATEGNTSSTAGVYLQSPECLIAYFEGSAEGLTTGQWQGRQVFQAGEEMLCAVETDTFLSLMVSGYLFNG